MKPKEQCLDLVMTNNQVKDFEFLGFRVSFFPRNVLQEIYDVLDCVLDIDLGGI